MKKIFTKKKDSTEKKVNVKKLIKASQAPALGKWNRRWDRLDVGDPTGVGTGCSC